MPVAACGGGEDDPKPVSSVPAGFEVPDGVTISKPGAQRKPGETATVVYQVDEQAASAITVTIANVRRGVIEDFRFFSLTPDQLASSPFYVDLTVVNEGPAGLGGAALPVFARDDSDMLLPPTPIVGSFAPCPSGQLPESFLPGSRRTCAWSTWCPPARRWSRSTCSPTATTRRSPGRRDVLPRVAAPDLTAPGGTIGG